VAASEFPGYEALKPEHRSLLDTIWSEKDAAQRSEYMATFRRGQRSARWLCRAFGSPVPPRAKLPEANWVLVYFNPVSEWRTFVY
jgi:hypothetical protein